MKIQGQKLNLAIKLEFAAQHRGMYSSRRLYEPYIVRHQKISKFKLTLAMTLAASFQSSAFFCNYHKKKQCNRHILYATNIINAIVTSHSPLNSSALCFWAQLLCQTLCAGLSGPRCS